MKVINRTFKRGYAYAPKILVEERKKVRFMYREEPDNDNDSGWRYFSGDEADEYVNNPDNMAIYDITTIAEIDPTIIPYLDSKYGSAFERENADEDFIVSQIMD